MKIIKLALLMVAISFPWFWNNRLQAEEQLRHLRTVQSYNYFLDTAVDDAAASLHANPTDIDKQMGYESPKLISINKEAALRAFLETLFININIVDDRISQDMLMSYIPAIAIVNYDGLDIWTEEEYVDSTGKSHLKHVWLPKIPFTYTDQNGYVYAFTLDDYVTVYLPKLKLWIKGYQRELMQHTALPLLRDGTLFESVRRTTIVNKVQDELAYRINRHNYYSKRIGTAYNFTFPTISEEEWNNSINDVGVLAFVQDLPMGAYKYNNYAIGGARLIRKDLLYGTMRDGIKIALPEKCKPLVVEEVLSNSREAVKRGYYVKYCS
ncbi:hypothetical protein MH117_06970 [Paenibacillus sp. ACRRX]|uniref:hypothetical protein n=1 Tax=Paenibacillus sp. ACRRX TaxID=2918206 RepID=UPI001EF3D89B|nr:hypothetical protein [Paenibacillus sp. ACRRX]MCG7407154.1 hypothetical protein [Paenibacillus sp. ACRRX]